MLLAGAACTTDRSAPTAPTAAAAAAAAAAADEPIVVATAAELSAALVPEHAGRRIVVRAGEYVIGQPLVVPDGATLEGAGVMQLDAAGRPTGFAPGTRTTITIAAHVPGDVLALGDGSVVRRLAIVDLPGRAGNAIGVVSRAVGDRLAATIADVDILVPSVRGLGPQGPTGCGIAVLSRNPDLGAGSPPHAGAAIEARISRTIVRAPAIGIGCGLFAFNFAPTASIDVRLADGVIGGGIIASGGVSRPDPVHDSRTTIVSHRTLYRDDTADPCTAQRIGWNVQGGAGVPAPQPNPGAARNTLRIVSTDDRLEGFTTGVLATGGRRFFAAPLAGPVTDNTVDLTLVGATISTPSCGGAPFVADLRLAGALVTDAAVVPGDGNTLRATLRDVTGSGTRFNRFADVLGPSGAQPPSLAGTGTRLLIAGSPEAFARTNRAIAPAPGAEFFTSGGW